MSAAPTPPPLPPSSPRSTPPPIPPPSVDRENPWPGLRSYDETMHEFFFGRTVEIDELLRLVRRDPVGLFFGQSGLGKSSVLQAGLFPKLRAADLLPVHIRLRYAAEFPHPVEQVLREVHAGALAAGGEASPPPPGSTLYEYFYDQHHEFWSARNRVLTPVLVFDQFEEIFTLGQRDPVAQQRRTELLQQLADLAARRPPESLIARFEENPELATRYAAERVRCRVLITMREDFLPDLGSLREFLPTLTSGTGLRLQRLRGTQAREVLEHAGAHLLDDGAAERIIRFVAAEKPGTSSRELAELEVEPALLSVVASELNHRRRHRGLARISADLVQGAREEILNDFYDRALAGLDGKVGEFIEEQLLTTTGFRDSVAVEDAVASYGVPREVISQLVDRRLLRIDERFQMQRVELTHDLLTGVVKSSRDRRRERQALAAAQQRADAEKRTAENAVASARAKLRRTRLRAAITGAMALLCLGVIVPTFLLRRANRANAAADKAMGSFLVMQANEHLAAANYNAARFVFTQTERPGLIAPQEQSLFAAVLNQPPVLTLRGVIDLPTVLALDATGDATRPAMGVQRPVAQVEFVPGGVLVVQSDGRLAHVAIEDQTATPQRLLGELATLTHVNAIDVRWGLNTLVAVGLNNGEVALFDLDTGERQQTISRAGAGALGANVVKTQAAPATGPGAPRTAKPDSGEGAPSESSGPTGAETEQPGILAVRFSWDGDQVAFLDSDSTLSASRVATGYSEAPRLLSTKMANLKLNRFRPRDVALAWAIDGSLMVGDADRAAWVPAPQEGWEDVPFISEWTIGVEPLYCTTPSTDFRQSWWFVSPRGQNNAVCMLLPSGSAPASNTAKFGGSLALPDTVHAFGAIPGTNLMLVALRNGTISALTVTPTGNENAELKLLQTVAGPRGSRVSLRIRPDGRLGAATSDTGRMLLYELAVPEARNVKVPAATARRHLVADQAGRWWQVRANLAIIPPAGIVPPAPLTPPDVLDSVLAVHFVPDDPDASLVLATSTEGESGETRFGVWSPATAAWLWQHPTTRSPGFSEPDFETTAVFSPQGDRIALTSGTPGVDILSATTGELVQQLPPLFSDPLEVAWSGDGRKLAIFNTDQDLQLFEVAPAAGTGVARRLALVHARASQISSLALDATGAALAYLTNDARLILHFPDRAIPVQAFIAPLPRPASGLAFGADGRSVALIENGELHVLADDAMTPEQLAWMCQSRLEGFGLATNEAPGNQLSAFSSRLEHEAASILALAPVIRDWALTSSLLSPALPTSENEFIDIGAVRQRFDHVRDMLAATDGDGGGDSGTASPHELVMSALRAELADAGNNPWRLLRTFELQPEADKAWPLFADLATPTYGDDAIWTVTANRIDGPDHWRFSADDAKELLPVLLKHLEDADATVTPGERAFARAIVHLLAHDEDRNVPIKDNRAVLRSARLLTPEEWDEIVFTSPDNWLLNAEGRFLYEENDYAGSSRFYQELMRRDPTNIRYVIQNAQNYRFSHRWEEAMAGYRAAHDLAVAAGEARYIGETLVSIGWCLEGLERLDEADASMAAGAEAAPESAWVQRQAATHFLDRGQFATAGPMTERLVAIEPTPISHMLRVRYLLTVPDPVGIREQVVLVGASDDTADQQFFDAGVILRDLATKPDIDAAASLFLKAYNKTSDRDLEFRSLGELGSAWMRINRYTGALECFRRRLEQYEPTPDQRLRILGERVWIRMHVRDFDGAVEDFTAGSTLDAELTEVSVNDRYFFWWAAGLMHENRGDEAAALAAFAHLRELSLSGNEAYAEALIRFGDKAKALDVVASALTKLPESEDLRYLHASLKMEADPAAGRRELTALLEARDPEITRQARALLGDAAAVADTFAAAMDPSPFAEDYLDLAGLRALAWKQTGDARQRQLALIAIGQALSENHRGNYPMRHLFGLNALATDPLFALAEAAIIPPLDSRESLYALARYELALAAALSAGDERDASLARARTWLRHGITEDVFTRDDLLALPDFAAHAPLPDDEEETTTETH